MDDSPLASQRPACWATLAVIGLVSSGCAAGVGIVEPGSTRTSHQMVSNVTHQGTSQVGYTKISNYKVDNIREVNQTTATAFGGTMVGVHVGSNSSSVDGHGGSGWVGEAFWESLLGRGRWAAGVRFGYMLRTSDDVDLNGDGTTDAATDYGGLPVTLHGYYGLSTRVSTHVGLGGDMIAFKGNPRSLRMMSGLRFALKSDSDGATLLVVDVDHLRSTRDAGAYRSFGVIAGLAFVK